MKNIFLLIENSIFHWVIPENQFFIFIIFDIVSQVYFYLSRQTGVPLLSQKDVALVQVETHIRLICHHYSYIMNAGVSEHRRSIFVVNTIKCWITGYDNTFGRTPMLNKHIPD